MLNHLNHNLLPNSVTSDPSVLVQLLSALVQHEDLRAIAVKRTLAITRLEKAKLCEVMGNNPWDLIFNSAYELCEHPCISVIVTLYNYSEYIYECLDSVCRSDISDLSGNIELLVVDDCSNDRSASIVKEYLSDSSTPICLIKKCFNTGLADARNVGLKIARSRYVFVLDADNWIDPNCLNILYNTINSSDYAAVYGRIRKVDNQSKKEVGLLSGYEWNVHKLIKEPYIDAMAMFDKDIVLTVGGYSTELIEYGWFGWEDYDLWLKLAQRNYLCKLVPTTLSSYRVHSSSMINTTNKYALNVAMYFTKKFPDLVKLYNNSEMFFGFQRSEIFSMQQPHFQPKQSGADLQELQQAYATIAAMQSSNFWKLRNQWFKLKKFLGLFLGLAEDIDIKL